MTGLYWGLRSTWPCAGVGAGARVGPVRERGAGEAPAHGAQAAGRRAAAASSGLAQTPRASGEPLTP